MPRAQLNESLIQSNPRRFRTGDFCFSLQSSRIEHIESGKCGKNGIPFSLFDLPNESNGQKNSKCEFWDVGSDAEPTMDANRAGPFGQF